MSNIEEVNLEQLSNSYRLVLQSLETASKNGSYGLTEAYTIRVAMSNIEKAIDTLGKYQKLTKEKDTLQRSHSHNID